MLNKLVSYSKKAAVFAAFFSITLAHQTASSVEKTETYKDLIEKAYNLSLQQDRTQALSILVGASKREAKRGLPQKELLTAIEEVANIFYSDKTQQLHELALSLKQADPAAALTKLNEAGRLEPDNLTILLETQRLLLATNDCSGALKLGEKILELDPYSEGARLHSAQATVCIGKFDQYLSFANSPNTETQSIYWLITDVERLFKKAEFDSALVKITQTEKLKSTYPESFYWQWRIETELKQKNDKSGQKYVSACRKLTPRQFREFSSDPNLCRRVAEVENSLKKSHNP